MAANLTPQQQQQINQRQLAAYWYFSFVDVMFRIDGQVTNYKGGKNTYLYFQSQKFLITSIAGKLFLGPASEFASIASSDKNKWPEPFKTAVSKQTNFFSGFIALTSILPGILQSLGYTPTAISGVVNSLDQFYISYCKSLIKP
jgi:hypothetical protein